MWNDGRRRGAAGHRPALEALLLRAARRKPVRLPRRRTVNTFALQGGRRYDNAMKTRGGHRPVEWMLIGFIFVASGFGASDVLGAEKEKEKEKSPPPKKVVAKPTGWDKKALVPLSRAPITFRWADRNEEGEPIEEDKFVYVDLKGDPKDAAEPMRIVVNVAQQSDRYAAVRVWVKSNADDFIERLNANRQRLIDITGTILGTKTMSQLESIGFRALLRAELMSAYNRAFKVHLITDVVLEGPAVQ